MLSGQEFSRHNWHIALAAQQLGGAIFFLHSAFYSKQGCPKSQKNESEGVPPSIAKADFEKTLGETPSLYSFSTTSFCFSIACLMPILSLV